MKFYDQLHKIYKRGGTMSYHHPFSPSGLGRRRLCPGSFLMEQKVKNPASSEYAKEGTMLHELIAARIEGNGYHTSHLTAEQVNALDNCYEWFTSEVLVPLTDQVGPQVWKWVKTEKKLALWEAFDNDDGYECIVSGTVDVLVDTRDGYGVIIDWKFGRADISNVTSMLQLTGYAILAFEEHEHLEAIESYIYQPRTGTIKKGLFDRGDLDVYKKTIRETISACLLKDPPLAASFDACAYCSAIGICPEAKDKAFGGGLAVIEREVYSVEEMDADTLGQTLDDMKVADKFLVALKSKCKEVMIDGQEATGWAIAERSGMKAIQNVEGLAECIQSYLHAGDILAVSTLSMVDFFNLQDTLTGAVSLKSLLPHAKVSVPKLLSLLTTKILAADEAKTKTEARRLANEMIADYVNEGVKIHALNRRKED